MQKKTEGFQGNRYVSGYAQRSSAAALNVEVQLNMQAAALSAIISCLEIILRS